MGLLQDIFREIKNLLIWWLVVAPWEEALRVRSIPFRKQTVVLLKPGLRWAFPFIDQVYSQSSRLRFCDLPVQTLTTADGKTLTLKGMFGYRIKNIQKLYDTVQHAENAFVEIVTSTVADYVFKHASGFTPEQIGAAVLDKLSFTKYGIGQIQFGITDFAYVRAYRLIQGDSYYPAGDKLKTDEVLSSGYQ